MSGDCQGHLMQMIFSFILILGYLLPLKKIITDFLKPVEKTSSKGNALICDVKNTNQLYDGKKY